MQMCYVCGRLGEEIRYSSHWRQDVCVECIQRTGWQPVGYLCETRQGDGHLCLEPAVAKRQCPAHTPRRGRRPRVSHSRLELALARLGGHAERPDVRLLEGGRTSVPLFAASGR